MSNIFKLLGISFAGLGAVVVLGAADAATGRNGAITPDALTRSGTSAARMPTMSISPVTGTGTLTGGGTTTPVTPPTPPFGPAPRTCPDSGIENSEYTVDNCMTDILACVNGGALPNGLNDLFNEDLRNSIFNGMGLCSVQVQKCVGDVRQNCNDIYANSSDVWIDFNARIIQPEYYSFILRKTGLTPNQAENTCWLLDKNTYGSSFTAVSNGGYITAEYNKTIGAYNNQAGGGLTKANPQGVTVNNNNGGVDGQRGHYARWDATTGECLIRVAGYNQDKQIKNSWLFDAAGNDEPAEVWKKAGDSFTCNKDLFGFSLMNDTSTVAVVGMGGGTLVGGTIGAIAGHGKRNFDCDNESALKKLNEQARAGNVAGLLNEYLNGAAEQISSTGDITKAQCTAILDLYDSYMQAKSINTKNCKINPDGKINATEINITKAEIKGADGKIDFTKITNDSGVCNLTDDQKKQLEEFVNNTTNVDTASVKISCTITTSDGADCTYHNLKKGIETGTKIICHGEKADCIEAKDFESQVAQLDYTFTTLSVLKEGEKSNMLKSTAIGAGVGLAAGGLATAITAFVEKNNISCHVGDGLKEVAYGKSHSIESLKDFYVKWNLRLPDTVMPTSRVTDCNSWKKACGSLTDLNQCAIAQVNYKASDTVATQLVSTACTVSGSSCVENSVVATSYGACDY